MIRFHQWGAIVCLDPLQGTLQSGFPWSPIVVYYSWIVDVVCFEGNAPVVRPGGLMHSTVCCCVEYASFLWSGWAQIWSDLALHKVNRYKLVFLGRYNGRCNLHDTPDKQIITRLKARSKSETDPAGVRHYDMYSYRLPWLGACWPALHLGRRPSLHRMFWKEMRAAV